MHSGFEPLVHVDWKIPGGELLALLQHYYPDHPAFSGAAFEALLDELSNEMPEVCLQTLAPVLRSHGYDLWNLDAGGDDYRPVIVPSAQRQAFATFWQTEHGGLALEPSLIEPEPPVPSAPKTAKRSKLKWLHEVHNYPAPTHLEAYNYRNGWAAITEQDDDQWLCFLIDYNPWPPTEQDMLEQRSDKIDGADLQLIDASAQRSLWKRRVKSGAYSRDDLFEYETRQGQSIQRFGPAGAQWPGFEEPCVVADGELFERQRLYEPTHLTRLWRITANSSEVIFEYPDELTVLPIGPRRLLFLPHNGSQCWVFNQDTGQHRLNAHPLPVNERLLAEASAYLGGDEILLFSEGERQNVENSAYQETVLLAWRFNLQTGATTQAVLDGFGSELRQETRIFVSQPKLSITLRTFHGQLQVARGHGDWWVWNYRTNTFGAYTLAWWWNQRSNQVLKLSSRDIPRIKPVIYYLPSQDRYLALETDFVARLPAFADMLEAKGDEFLAFK